jgi:O-antigen/teichoic acid export membrane protein
MSYKLYLSHVGTLLTGTVIAQSINFASYPVLTRTYTSEAFGHFALFMSVASIIGPLACGRFDIVVQSAPFAQRFAAHRLAVTLAAIVSVVSAITYAVIVSLGLMKGDLLSAALLGVAIFFTGYCFSASAFIIKHEQYRASSMAMVARTAMTALPQIGLFWLLPGEMGLTVGFCIGLGVHAWMLAATISRLPTRRTSRGHVGAVMRIHRRYPLFDVPATFLSNFSMFATSFFLIALYSAAEVGYYNVAFRLAALPMAVFANSLSEVYFQRAARAFQEEGRFWSNMRFNIAVAGTLAIAIFLPMALVARPVISIYLGAEWTAVAEVIIALTPMMALRFVYITISSTPLLIGKPHWLLIGNVVLALTMLGSFALAKILTLDFSQYLWLSSLTSAACYGAYIIWFATVTLRRYR